MISLHLRDGHQQCQLAEHRKTESKRNGEQKQRQNREGDYEKECTSICFFYIIQWQALNAAQTNTFLSKNKHKLGLNGNITLTHFSPETHSLWTHSLPLSLCGAFAILHIGWQTYGFVEGKMAFQRVIINYSHMKNSFDIYTLLGVCLTVAGRQ